MEDGKIVIDVPNLGAQHVIILTMLCFHSGIFGRRFTSTDPGSLVFCFCFCFFFLRSYLCVREWIVRQNHEPWVKGSDKFIPFQRMDELLTFYQSHMFGCLIV